MELQRKRKKREETGEEILLPHSLFQDQALCLVFILMACKLLGYAEPEIVSAVVLFI